MPHCSWIPKMPMRLPTPFPGSSATVRCGTIWANEAWRALATFPGSELPSRRSRCTAAWPTDELE